MPILQAARFGNGDLWLDNLLVRDRQLVGVKDLENAGFSDPIYISISWSWVECRTYPVICPVGKYINRAYASAFTAFIALANRVVYEDGLNFWGGATIFDPNGVLLAKGPYHYEELVPAEIDFNQLHRTRARLPLPRAE